MPKIHDQATRRYLLRRIEERVMLHSDLMIMSSRRRLSFCACLWAAHIGGVLMGLVLLYTGSPPPRLQAFLRLPGTSFLLLRCLERVFDW